MATKLKTEDLLVGFFAVTLGGLGIAAFATAVVLTQAWALSVLWNWYAVPFFHLARMSIPMAIGLRILIALILGDRGRPQFKDRSWGTVLGEVFLGPAVSVFVGWVARWWL
jgi:hypothetical protein